MRPTFSACLVRRARAAMPGTKSWCTSSTTVIAPAISWKFCRGSTSICGGRRHARNQAKWAPVSRPIACLCNRASAARRKTGLLLAALVARPPSCALEIEIPELGDHVFAPAAAGLARGHLEPRALVDVPCSGEHAVRPQSDLCVTFGSCKAHTLIHKSGTQSQPARFGVHQQQAQA